MNEQLLDVRKKARRSFAILCLWIPLAVFAVISIVQLALLPLLPETVATHWGSSGEADGFGPAWTYPVMTFGLGGFLTALIAGTALFEIKSATQRTQYRFLGAIIGAETGFLGTMMLGLVILQVGLEDPATAPNSYWILALGLAVAVVMGAVWFFLIEEPPAQDAAEAEVQPLDLTDTEQAVWVRTISMARVAGIVLGVVLGLTIVMMIAVCFAVLRDEGSLPIALWGSLVLVLLATLLVICCLNFTVTVDASGITVRSFLGWPKTHVPAAQITSAKVVEVSPMAEFGGWGWRIGANGTGIVLRAGEGVRVGREGKSDLTVTVDDAETAVALLRRTIHSA